MSHSRPSSKRYLHSLTHPLLFCSALSTMSTRHSFLSTTGLLRSPSSASLASTVPSMYSAHEASKPAAPMVSEKTSSRLQRVKNLRKLRLPTDVTQRLRGTSGVIPLGSTFIVGIAIIMSLFFIGAISFAFIGGEDAPAFQDVLNNLAQTSPGVSVKPCYLQTEPHLYPPPRYCS